jgi:hypothetical protein
LEKGQIERPARDRRCDCGKMSLMRTAKRRDDSGRLDLVHGVCRARPIAVDDGKKPGPVERRNESRPLGIGHKEDRAGLGHHNL